VPGSWCPRALGMLREQKPLIPNMIGEQRCEPTDLIALWRCSTQTYCGPTNVGNRKTPTKINLTECGWFPEMQVRTTILKFYKFICIIIDFQMINWKVNSERYKRNRWWKRKRQLNHLGSNPLSAAMLLPRQSTCSCQHFQFNDHMLMDKTLQQKWQPPLCVCYRTNQ